VLRLQHLDEEPGEAIAILRDLIRFDPGDIWSWREISSWYARLGKFDRALDAADHAIAVQPNDSTSHWFRGRALELSKKYGDASDEYRSVIELQVDNAYAISSLLPLARTVEAKRQALEFIWRELNRQPSSGEGLFTYRDEARRVIDRVTLLQNLQDYYAANRRSWFAASAVIQQLSDMGRFEDAEKLALDATERFPLNNQTWLDLAVVRKMTGNVYGEIEALRTGNSLSPVWSFGVQQLADAYQRAGRFTEARDILLNALTRLPFDNYLLGFLADSHWNLGERQTAIETAKRAILIEPDYEWAWGAIKRWAEQIGDHDLPATLARELTEKKPKDIRAWINLAEMLETGVFSQERLDAVNQALRIDPFSANALAIKVTTLADARRFDEAIEVAQTRMPDGHRPEQLRYVEAGIESLRGNNSRSIDILIELTESSPGYLPGWLRLADVYRLDPERGREYRRAAMEIVKLAPREATAFGYLAEACLMLDLKEEARDALQQAVILDPTYEYGVRNLFEILLDTNDLAEAARLVETVRDASKITGLPIAVELAIRKGEWSDVLKWLRELLVEENVSRERLDQVIDKAVSYLGKTDVALLDLLREVSDSDDVNPVAGRYLIDAAWRSDKKRGAEKELESVAQHSALWAHGASRFMEILAAETPESLRKFIDSNADKLAVETESWGAVGYQLTNLNDLDRTAQWFANWETRDDPMPWMLWNYSILLRRGHKADEADAVNSAALELKYDDTVNLHLATLGLSEFTRGNVNEASAIFAGINPGPMTEWDRFFYDVLNEALWAHERIAEGDMEAGKALVDSIVDKIISFDPKNADPMVRDLAGGALSLLLQAIGSTWFTLLKKGKMLYSRFG
jgi:tetratricopeptide (TPR) repeat protein